MRRSQQLIGDSDIDVDETATNIDPQSAIIHMVMPSQLSVSELSTTISAREGFM